MLIVARTCSWCHELNDYETGQEFCKHCHHRAFRPRLVCDCLSCELARYYRMLGILGGDREL